jgi:hypothetical protein
MRKRDLADRVERSLIFALVRKRLRSVEPRLRFFLAPISRLLAGHATSGASDWRITEQVFQRYFEAIRQNFERAQTGPDLASLDCGNIRHAEVRRRYLALSHVQAQTRLSQPRAQSLRRSLPRRLYYRVLAHLRFYRIRHNLPSAFHLAHSRIEQPSAIVGSTVTHKTDVTQRLDALVKYVILLCTMSESGDSFADQLLSLKDLDNERPLSIQPMSLYYHLHSTRTNSTSMNWIIFP